MDKRESGGLGLSPRSVEQLERVIDTADTILYPAHLMIGGWRMFFAAVLLAAYGICFGLWWICDNIYHFGVMYTIADAYQNTAALVRAFPWVSAIVVLVVGVPVFWCFYRFSAGSLNCSWRFASALSSVLLDPALSQRQRSFREVSTRMISTSSKLRASSTAGEGARK